MKAFISHQSALEFWRIQLVLPQSDSWRCRATLSGNLPAIEQVWLPGLTLPLHIMLQKAGTRRTRQEMKQHVFTGQTPAGCFISIDNTLFVSTPEFCFLQMADTLPLVRLIELGYELCGSYSMHTEGDPNIPTRGFHLRDPLTNVKKLEAFVSRMPGIKGHQKAVRALRYILDGSASPMETKLSIILSLPYKLGGFGFAQPELNRRIIPSKTGKRVSNKASYFCDLFWPDNDLAVEYDSALYHAGQNQIAEDSKRRNSLITMGIAVVAVTKQQLYDEKEFEKIAWAVAKCLGKRINFRNSSFAAAHQDLREYLL